VAALLLPDAMPAVPPQGAPLRQGEEPGKKIDLAAAGDEPGHGRIARLST
jgi:hypothetical protein